MVAYKQINNGNAEEMKTDIIEMDCRSIHTTGVSMDYYQFDMPTDTIGRRIEFRFKPWIANPQREDQYGLLEYDYVDSDWQTEYKAMTTIYIKKSPADDWIPIIIPSEKRVLTFVDGVAEPEQNEEGEEIDNYYINITSIAIPKGIEFTIQMMYYYP